MSCVQTEQIAKLSSGWGWRPVRALALWLCLAVLGCAHYPVNAPLATYSPNAGYRFNAFDDASNSDALFVCLTFSGGGTRAGAFAYGVLSKLASIAIPEKDGTKRLIDEVDCVSSVSGGSFTAAYYALFGDRIFQDFGERFLYRDLQNDLFWKAFNPLNFNWARLLSPNFGRIDLAAEVYDETIFERKTFADLLARKRRPFMILNATHLETGERFEFNQEQFDLLGSDLQTFSVGRAVAASSAFPFLLSPISLKNHPHPAGYTVPQDLRNALKDYYVNPRRYTWAKDRLVFTDKSEHPYAHLMDGGLADNLGLRAVSDEYRRGFIRERIAGKIRKLVVIVVNSRTEPHEDVDKEESPPGLDKVAYKTATTSMDNYTFETVEMMRDLAEERVKAQKVLLQCQKEIEKRCPAAEPLPPLAGGDLKPYIVEINFEGVTDERERACFLNLPTSFKLTRAQVDALVGVAGELLDQHPKFRELLAELGVDPVGARSPERTARCS